MLFLYFLRDLLKAFSSIYAKSNNKLSIELFSFFLTLQPSLIFTLTFQALNEPHLKI